MIWFCRLIWVPKSPYANRAGFALLLVDPAAIWHWWRWWIYKENQLKWLFIRVGCIFYLFILKQTCYRTQIR